MLFLSWNPQERICFLASPALRGAHIPGWWPAVLCLSASSTSPLLLLSTLWLQRARVIWVNFLSAGKQPQIPSAMCPLQGGCLGGRGTLALISTDKVCGPPG